MLNLDTLTQEQKANVIRLIKVFANFNLNAKLTEVSVGPIVTGYSFSLLGNTQIANINARREDIALALGTDTVSIGRVGQSLVLYVPNTIRQVIDFKDYLHWYMHDETVQAMHLPIALGIDPEGNKQALSLASCPHILIAGQTNAGKSVFESAIITCLAARYSSDELKLYLVDAKQVDLPLFKALPHVKSCAKSVTEYFTLMQKLYGICKHRLDMFNATSTRNIVEYEGKTGKDMAYIVLMIDEFAALMDEDKAIRSTMSKQEAKETPSVTMELKALAQISRAAGIHIILGTQRSSVKVISGDIKVNFPCRIALSLPSAVDSRTILDEGGAETLLGCGDMLVRRPDRDVLQRYHGPFVKLSDIENIITNLEEIREFL